MPRVEGKVAIVTGASRGMGATEARLLAREGAAVVLCDMLDDRGAAVAAEIVKAGGAAIYRHLDVTSEDQWRAVVAEAEQWRGRIDVLVNNAGINIRAPIGEVRVEDWNRVMAVNLTGPLLGTRAVAPVMRKTGGGSIVNIASAAALQVSASVAYTSSKWGLRGMSKVAALEFAEWGIRVNTVCPGVVPTELNAGQPYLATVVAKVPLGRNGTQDEVANAVLFLASDELSFITGADIPVDGGITLGKTR